MKAPSFKKWFARLPALNQPQRLLTLAALHPAAGLDRIVALIGQIGAQDRRCPRCACTRHYRHGQANGLQRYRCRDCGRTFNDLGGTPLARLRMRENCCDWQSESSTDNGDSAKKKRTLGCAPIRVTFPAV